jgi:2-polyprenyl-3-methyl-5-hydroxy-6-metoxy-1,4-benzoquinol methylase
MDSKPSLQAQQSFYDTRWKDCAFVNHAKLERCIAILESIASTKLDEPDIVELGCGSGWLTAILGSFGPATGIELSPVAVTQASARYPHVKFIQADLSRLDYPQEQFDLVVSHEVIEHLEDQLRHLEAAHKLLRKGGYLILTTPNKSIYGDSLAQGETEMQPIENWINKGTLRSMAQSYFEIVRLTTIRPFPRKGIFRAVNYYTLRSLAGRVWLRYVLEKLVCTWGGGLHLLLVAKKTGKS